MNGFDYYEDVLDTEKFATAIDLLTDSSLFDAAIYDPSVNACDGDGIPFHKDWKGNKYFN